MKKAYIIVPLIVFVLVAGFLFTNDRVKRNIIILRNGDRISADETWKVGEKLFYKNNHKVAFVAAQDVDAVEARYHLASGRTNPSTFLAEPAPPTTNYARWIKTAGAALSGAFLLVGLYFLSRRFVRVRKPMERDDTKDCNSDLQTEYSGREAVVAFFLDIFRCQKGLPGGTEAKLKPVQTLSPQSRWIYELRLKNGDDWDSRRMTLGTLAEDRNNRSTVYDIIYDDRLVVKIPPTPISDFNQYANLIAKERTIAEKLSPKECLVPGLAVILEKVKPSLGEPDLPPEMLEEKYTQLLESDPEYRKYLKVGDTFAFFMDFSKYFFVSHIINEIHDSAARVSKSAVENPNIIWDPVEFDAKYGAENIQIYDRLQPVYAAFEKSVGTVLQRNHVAFSIQEFQLKDWFLRCLSGVDLTAPNLDVNAKIAAELNALASKHFLVPEEPVQAFRIMGNAHFAERNLNHYKSQISGIITNLLDLVAWLRAQKVAIRDLKPDNLLVAGDPARFPLFLESASQYSIGSIDVETAVFYGVGPKQQIDQPELAGTPSYATPSHLFANETIEHALKDLPLAFCLQDWYAAVAIIYRIVTGSRLFEHAAGVLVELQREIPRAFEENRRPAMVFEEASRRYWKTAVAEFEKKIRQKKGTLERINTIVSTDAKRMLIPAMTAAQKRLMTSAEMIVASQNVFAGEKIKKHLLSASLAKIKHLKTQVQPDRTNPNVGPEDKKEALAVLEQLERIKSQSDHLTSALGPLHQSVPQVSSYGLLKAMFTIVLIHMYQEPWGIIERE